MRSLLSFPPICWASCVERAYSSRLRYPKAALVQNFVSASPQSDGASDSSADNDKPKTLVRCRARVAYDGCDFQGFQLQGGRENTAVSGLSPTDDQQLARTVQGELEPVLQRRFQAFGPQNIRVVAAGRTDSGVHARGQAIHFDVNVTKGFRSDNESPKDVLRREISKAEFSIGRMLPNDLALWNLQVAPGPFLKLIDGKLEEKQWSAMYDSTCKMYSYRLHTGPVMMPTERFRRWHPDMVHTWFDEDRFQRLVSMFEGSHDFRAFANAMPKLEASKRLHHLLSKQENNKIVNGDILDNEFVVNTVRTVRSAKLIPEFEESGPDSYRVDILLEGALFKQVRNMIGAVVEVCRPKGCLTEEQLVELLKGNKTRQDNRAKPAPPQALTLERVFFDEEGF